MNLSVFDGCGLLMMYKETSPRRLAANVPKCCCVAQRLCG